MVDKAFQLKYLFLRIKTHVLYFLSIFNFKCISNDDYTTRGAGAGILAGFTSEIGTDGVTSSFGSTMDT